MDAAADGSLDARETGDAPGLAAAIAPAEQVPIGGDAAGSPFVLVTSGRTAATRRTPR